MRTAGSDFRLIPSQPFLSASQVLTVGTRRAQGLRKAVGFCSVTYRNAQTCNWQVFYYSQIIFCAQGVRIIHAVPVFIQIIKELYFPLILLSA